MNEVPEATTELTVQTDNLTGAKISIWNLIGDFKSEQCGGKLSRT